MKRLLLLFLCSVCCFNAVRADEGMWLPSLIGDKISDMQAKGFRLTADDIYNINQASMKDAIVRFGGGCTGEIVSADGLLLTNHHCGYGQIQAHSSLEHDYLTNGFWALSREEELPNPGLTVSFLVRMEDVTDRIENGEKEEKIIKKATEGGRYSASIESLYYGNQYFLFVYEVFRDVRLVAAPPSSIGKFGGDTDNWMWPRHTGDFSIFRVYADKNNRPADYSEDNVPYHPKHFFKISTKGVEQGDFTMIYGFPGTTRRYVTSDFVDYTLNHTNPLKIKLRTMRLNTIKAAQEADPQVRIMYASKQASIANAWKKWQGESLGLERLGTIEKKKAYEARFQEWADSGKAEYKDVLPQLHAAYAELLPYAIARDLYVEAFSVVELITAATGAQRDNWNSELFYKNYSAEIDSKIAKQVWAEYMTNAEDRFIPAYFKEQVAQHGGMDAFVDDLFGKSDLVSREKYESAKAAGKDLSQDPAYLLGSAFTEILRGEIQERYLALNNQITDLYHVYMQGQMAFEPDRIFFPDANSTLRVAYGKVQGYEGDDAITYRHFTTLEGVMEKDSPEIYDYDVPERLREIYRTKDYGRWAINIGSETKPRVTVPVAFIATNHTTGGNSGSPVLNGNGELLGINFDRTWVSTMSDLEFDEEYCRNIAVDIRFVLFVIEKIGGAEYLFDEMVFSE
ncbi:MAG: S46 family peptidase [Tidjanibacter sp.]|nr:S46 family peptidase [Tidjanibacter sp.]